MITAVPFCNLKQLEVQDNLVSPTLKAALEAACAEKAGLVILV